MERKNQKQKIDSATLMPAKKAIKKTRVSRSAKTKKPLLKKPSQKRMRKSASFYKRHNKHFSSTLAVLRTVRKNCLSYLFSSTQNRNFLLMLTIVWMAGIFYLSSMPGSGAYYEMPRVLLLERKGAHIFEYFVLALLFARILRLELPKNRIRVLWLSAFLTISYAITDETHQLFIFGRTGKVTDVLIDGAGVLLACTLSFFLMSSKKK